MIRKANPDQEYLEDFKTQFYGKLKKDNRWIKQAELLPWEVIEDQYATNFSKDKGIYAINGRIAFGALYIQGVTGLPDREVVEYISENPYAQYFLGLSEFTNEPLFDASMMVHFRKRFPADFINRMNQIMFESDILEGLVEKIRKEREAGGGDDRNPPTPPRLGGTEESGKAGNRGKLLLDATVAPADIRYPSDISILNEARENMEQIIEELWEYGSRKGHKTGYSRKKARKEYLSIAKQKKPRYARTWKAIGRQLGYIRKDIDTVGQLLMQTGLDVLPEKRIARIMTVCEVYRQQLTMYRKRIHSCEDRIVSLKQPHIRPVVRGKTGKPYEFGQKITVSVIEGYTFIEKQSYDNFNEGVTLRESVERYRARYGFYPEAVLADMLFRNRENLKYCRERGIRLSGPPLGRPKKNPTKDEKRQAARDGSERNTIEGRFGIAKRKFGLGLIMSYLPETGKTEAAMQVLCMNVRLKVIVIFSFFRYRVFGVFLKNFVYFAA